MVYLFLAFAAKFNGACTFMVARAHVEAPTAGSVILAEFY
jgi:hypothetical protein